MAAGSAVALFAFGGYGLPILIEGIVRAFTGLASGMATGDLPKALDSAFIITVEGALQVMFLVTFWRRHRHRLAPARRRRSRAAVPDH